MPPLNQHIANNENRYIMLKKNLPNFVNYIIFCLIIFISTSAAAKVVISPWSGNVQFGFNGSSGNTSASNLDGKFNLAYKHDKWQNTLALEAIRNTSKGKTSAQRYTTLLAINYYNTPHNFLFYNNNNTYDKFNAYDISITNAVGIGRQLIANATKTLTLDVQAGPGYRYQRAADTHEVNKGLIASLGSTLGWQLTKIATLNENITVQAGRDNTQTQSKTALSTQILGNLGLQIGFTVTHNSKIPFKSKNTKHTDYYTSVNLLFAF